jgi:rhodanese-related sulfurtransferase
VRVVSAREAHEAWRAGQAAIVDVREEDEHEITRVPGVPLIPMSVLLARLDELPRDAELVLICHSGSRSGYAADYLTEQGGHGEVANLEGGIIAWAAEGLPYEGESPG